MLIVVLVNMFFKDRCKLFDFEGRGRSTAEKGTWLKTSALTWKGSDRSFSDEFSIIAIIWSKSVVLYNYKWYASVVNKRFTENN